MKHAGVLDVIANTTIACVTWTDARRARITHPCLTGIPLGAVRTISARGPVCDWFEHTAILRVIADAVVACIARTHARRTARAGASLTGVSIRAIKPIITGCAIRDGLEQAAILGVVTDAAVACVSWATTRRSCRASASLAGVSVGAE